MSELSLICENDRMTMFDCGKPTSASFAVLAVLSTWYDTLH